LGRDYLTAGVFDRAEKLFEELVRKGEQVSQSLRYLLQIYELEKDWKRCIDTAKHYARQTGNTLHENIAQYWCELADGAYGDGSKDQAAVFAKKALSMHRGCVRASLLLGRHANENKKHKTAIKFYKQVQEQDKDFLSEAILPLATCYEAIGNETEFMIYLQKSLSETPRASLVLRLAEILKRWHGSERAVEFITNYLRQSPSLRGLHRVINIHLEQAKGSARENLLILHDLTTRLLEGKPIYRCRKCGFSGKTLHWHCPGCKMWGTVKPVQGVEGE